MTVKIQRIANKISAVEMEKEFEQRKNPVADRLDAVMLLIKDLDERLQKLEKKA